MDFSHLSFRAKEIAINLKDRIKSDKRMYIPLLAFFVVIFLSGSYFAYHTLSLRWAVPSVAGANYSLEYRKIPYNTKSIDITFSTPLDAATLREKTVTISPFVEGHAEIKNDNTVSYVLTNTLSIGEQYTLVVGAELASKYGVRLGEDRIFNFEAIAGATATKILPSDRLDNLSQGIVVLFNIPVVPLGDLANMDRLPCPLDIAPKIAGKCRWTNGNVLEFTPEKPLQPATKYHLKVASADGLLYPLTSVLEDDIITPPITFSSVSNGFDPKHGISLDSNTPLDPAELQKNIVLTEAGKPVDAVVTPDQNDKKVVSETRFTVQPKDHPALYATAYALTIKKGLKPKYGTESLSADVNFSATSATFISNISVARNIYDATGTLVDTHDYGNDNSLIPSEHVFYRVDFADEVTIDPNLFILKSADNKVVPTTLAYVQESVYDDHGNDTGKKRDNKREIKITPTITLTQNTSYDFIVAKKANPSMPNDEIRTRTTAPKFVVSDFKFLNNTAACIYTNNDFGINANGSNDGYSNEYSLIRTIPESKTHDLIIDGGLYNPKTGKQDSYCPDVKWKNAYVVGLRPNPNTAYTIIFPSNLEDSYGQKLGKDVSYAFKTGPIASIDKYLYSSLDREVQVIPSNLPITLNLQSINIDSANLEVCEMDMQGYFNAVQHSSNAYFTPTCVHDTTTSVALKNRYWNLTPNRIDIEKDVLSGSLSTPFVFVRASIDRFNRAENGTQDNGREFSHIFVRSNLSLTLEDGKDKKTLFASSYDGKEIPSDLTFETYSQDVSGQFVPVGTAKSSSDFMTDIQNDTKWWNEFALEKWIPTPKPEEIASKAETMTLEEALQKPSDNAKYAAEFAQWKKSKGYGPVVNAPSNALIAWNVKKQAYELNDPKNSVTLVVAKNSKYFGIVSKSSDQVSNYDFKYISGQDSSTKDYLYIYSDRPLYHAGDTVYYKGLLRSFFPTGYRPTVAKKAHLKIVGEPDESGQWSSLQEFDITLDKNANLNGSFILPKEMPFGRYHFELYTGDEKTYVYNNGEFYVDAYKKPVFKVSVNTPNPDATFGDSVDVKANAEYYFGGKLANTDYNYSVLAQNYFFDAKDYRDYQFGRDSVYFDCLYWGSCEFSDSLQTTGTGRLDSNGAASIHFDYPKKNDDQKTLGEKIYTYTVEATDPDTGKTVSNQASQIFHTTDAYLGIRVPYWNIKQDGIKVSGVVLGYDAKAISGRDVELKLIHREWKDIKKQGVDGSFYHDYSMEEKEEQTLKTSSDNKGEFSETITPGSDGEYEVRATYTGKNGESYVSSQIIAVSGDSNTIWNNGNNSVTDVIADKGMVQIGEKAGFTVKSPVKSGKMFVAIEKDDTVLDSWVQDIHSNTERIEFPVSDAHLPNIYVKVFLIGQDDGQKLPTYKRGLAVLKVATDPKKLSVTVTTDKARYLPGDTVKTTVTVRDAAGQPVANANGSLSAVDESLLALAGNPKKNPFAFFYDMKRYLGVETYVSLLNLIERLEVKDTSLGEKWGAGDGQKGGSSRKKRGVFKDTAYWQADFTTDKNGTFTITTDKLPDNLTTWVLESVVSTPGDNRIGIGETTITTTKSVIVNDNLPRFLGSGDHVVFAPVVFNKTGQDQNFDVMVAATFGNLKDTKKSVNIKSGESATLAFAFDVSNDDSIRSSASPNSQITIKAVASNGDLDEVELTLPIVDTMTTETTATVGRTNSSADEHLTVSEAARKAGGTLRLGYAATLLPSLTSGLDFLARFPYGCSEQQTSAIMGTVYLKSLYNSIKLPYDLKEKKIKEYVSVFEWYRDVSLDQVIRNYLSDIRSFTTDGGGIAYWKDGIREPNFHLTSYVVTSLSEIQSIGYALNADFMTRAVAYLKSEFTTNRRPHCIPNRITGETCEYPLSERLAAVEAILMVNSQDYDAYKLYKLLPTDKLAGVGKVNQARVIARLLNIKDISEAEKVVLKQTAADLIKSVASNQLAYNPRGAFLGRDSAYSRLESTARFVEAIALLGPNTVKEYTQIVDQMQRWLISQKKSDGSFGSTQDTIVVVRAITTALRASGELQNVNMNARFALDGNEVAKRAIDDKNKLEIFAESIGLDRLQSNSTLHIERNGNGTLYYDLGLTYGVLARDLPARDEGFYVEQKYYDYDAYRATEKLKNDEWQSYLSGSIEYADLKYPKEVTEYLTMIDSWKVGKLVYVANRIITGEPRDQVAFEGFIPSGSELVNPNLKTESALTPTLSQRERGYNGSIFDRDEYRDDRYFATTSSLDAGVYRFGYIIRPTHEGTYMTKPARAFEFYHPEVFGRERGREVKVEK